MSSQWNNSALTTPTQTFETIRRHASSARAVVHNKTNTRENPGQSGASTPSVRCPIHEAISPSTAHDNRHVNSCIRPTISERDFERCRQGFRSLLENCGGAFLVICHAISLILVSFRPLHKEELKEALILLLGETTVLEAIAEDCRGASGALKRSFWPKGSETLWMECTDGKITFVLPSMKVFLQKVRIRGIDPSHRLMAQACLERLRTDAYEAHSPGNASEPSAPGPAFSQYASEHWAEHTRIAELTSFIEKPVL